MKKILSMVAVAAILGTGANAATNSEIEAKVSGQNVMTITDIVCEATGSAGFTITISNEKIKKIGSYDSCTSAKIAFVDPEWTLPEGHSVPNILMDGSDIFITDPNTGNSKLYSLADLDISESDLVSEDSEITGTVTSHTFSVSEDNKLFLNGNEIDENFGD